ncbi:MAG: transcriptional repressor [Endomicrobiia bacterium]
MKLHIKNIEKDFNSILKQKKLRNTKQRKQILEAFFSTDGHISVDEFYVLMKKINPQIGYATVHRTLQLFDELGIAESVKIGNKKKLYEHKYAHKHHDHLICIECKEFIEITSDELEILQKKLAKNFDFQIIDHKLIIYGICKNCKK